MINLGYTRVSTEKQNLDMQLAALTPLCGNQIRHEKKSGMTQAGRTELAAVVAEAQKLRAAGEDVCIVVYSLSRLGRKLVETAALIEELQAAGIAFKSVSESIDTSTAMGRCFLNILLSLGQMEAEVISERTKAGLAVRKQAGQKLGPTAGDYSEQLDAARQLLASGVSARTAAVRVGMSSTTLLRLLKVA
jgi:serine recombinase